MNNERIKRLNDLMSGYKKEAEKIEDMRLGFLLSRSQYSSLRGEISRDKEFIVGKFGFSVHSHDTGVGVIVDLIANDGERLNIINGTYWYNEGQYGFNKFHRLNGAWDIELEKAISHIRKLELTLLNNDFISWTNQLQELKCEDKSTIGKFEAEFN